MAYKKKTYKLRAGIEVEEYHSAKYGAPGQERRPKKKLTPEQMEKQNLANREKTVRRKLREHFQKDDYFRISLIRKMPDHRIWGRQRSNSKNLYGR